MRIDGNSNYYNSIKQARTENLQVRGFGQEFYGKDSQTVEETKNSTQTVKRGFQVYMKTEDMLFSGGNGTGLSFYIKYAKDTTKDNPSVIAKGVDENGKEFEQTIYINKIDPKNATVVEMRALEAHIGADKGAGLSSFSLSAGNMGLRDRRDFMNMFQHDMHDMNLLGERQKVSFYLKNMNMYYDFINAK